MIDKFCIFLTNKIRKKMPEIDEERAEIINFGLQNIIGELPKTFLIILIACLLGIGKETLLTFLILIPYKNVSGGFHLKTHLGCIVGTTLFYCGTAFFAQKVILNNVIKYILLGILWIFGIIMIKLYAPADTENVPILRKKDRRKQQILSYIVFSLGIVIAGIINNSVISNIILLGYFLQTLTITKLAYKLTNNKYGYEVYCNTSTINV